MKRILDLFCCAGLASDGYHLAGFTPTGVDINPRPHYPYQFIHGDALAVLEGDETFVRTFDAIHASPPCQAHTRAKHLRTAQGGTAKFDDLLTPTLDILMATYADMPWIVENVPGAPGMEDAVTLCGSSFGLGVRRHRLFKSNVTLESPPCDHKTQGRPWGVYHVPSDSIPQGGRTALNLAHGMEVMGVPEGRLITWNELKEGLPPVYTQHLGKQLMEAI